MYWFVLLFFVIVKLNLFCQLFLKPHLGGLVYGIQDAGKQMNWKTDDFFIFQIDIILQLGFAEFPAEAHKDDRRVAYQSGENIIWFWFLIYWFILLFVAKYPWLLAVHKYVCKRKEKEIFWFIFFKSSFHHLIVFDLISIRFMLLAHLANQMLLDSRIVYCYYSHCYWTLIDELLFCRIPSRTGPGNFVVHYCWSGYCDCIVRRTKTLFVLFWFVFDIV